MYGRPTAPELVEGWRADRTSAEAGGWRLDVATDTSCRPQLIQNLSNSTETNPEVNGCIGNAPNPDGLPRNWTNVGGA